MTTIRFCFETNEGAYVPVLGDSALVAGNIASQDAGSSDPHIYYQVGGGGLNGLFARALGRTTTAQINAQLVSSYEARYGAGSYAEDAAAAMAPGPSDRLTSFYVPVSPGVGAVGQRVVGLVYSVGPVLGSAGLTDPEPYAAVYQAAIAAVAGANAGGANVVGLRITMLSTGIYAFDVGNLQQLYDDTAAAIVRGIEEGVARASTAQVPLTILINTEVDATGYSKVESSFTRAAEDRGLTVAAGVGFELVVP